MFFISANILAMGMFKKKSKAVINSAVKAQDKLVSIEKSLGKRPPYAFVRDFLFRFRESRITSRSAEISYYLLLAIFPFILFLLSLLALINRVTTLQQDFLSAIESIIPEAVHTILTTMISEITASSNVTFLSFSMLGFIWAASKGFSVILRSLREIYVSDKIPSGFIFRLLGLLSIFLLVLSILVTMLLVTFGDLLFAQLAYWSGLGFLAGNLLQAGRYLLSFVFLLFIFSFLYFFVSGRKGRYRQALLPAAFTSISWFLFSFGFSWYLANFNRYATLYGSIGGMMILLLWLYISASMVLSGGIIHEILIATKTKARPD